ncbi:hypothetical protein V8C86DRAFT_3106951 [Haematococcus lacustris]
MPDSSQTSLQMLGNKDRPAPTAVESPPDAKAVITSFYEAYNRGDLDTVASLMAEEVEYHDMCGQLGGGGGGGGGAVRRTVPSDLQFVVEDITQGDPRRVGLTWHVEIGEGTVFPFSRGCSFYTLDDSGKIIKVARDLVEGAFKPGSGALQALAAVAPLIRRLGPRADPRSLTRLPLAAAATWAFYAGGGGGGGGEGGRGRGGGGEGRGRGGVEG